MDISRANEAYTSCGRVVEMSWHRAGVLLLGAQSCLPVPEVPAVGGVGSVLLSMARMGWKLCHVFRPYIVVGLIASIREKFSSHDFDTLLHLAQKVTLHEQRFAEARKNFKKINHVCPYIYGSNDDDDIDSEVAAAEWVRSKKVIPCQWVKKLWKRREIQLPAGHIIPSAEELGKRRYCKWHNSGSHSTNDCKNQERRVQRLRNRQRFQEVEQEINHRLKKTKPRQEWRVKNQAATADEVKADEAKRLAKGKSVVTASVNMVFTLPAEFGANQADVDEIEEASARLVLLPEQASFEKPEGTDNRHLKPLYTNGYVNGKPMSKMMVDGGATVHLMQYATFKKLGRNAKDLIKTNMVLKDFGGNPSENKGVLNVELTIGSKTVPTTFFVIDGKGSYSLLLGRDWIHANCCIPSTMHQCMIQWQGDKIEIVPADRVCIDFRDLNKATPKDEYPKPVADQLVDAASRHKILSFMDGIEITQRSANAIKKIQPSENKTELQEMIGKINFVKRFISILSGRLEPFTPLLRLKADQKFVWGVEQQKVLDGIKEYLSAPPVLIPPQKGIPFRLYPSAGEKSIGSVLIQEVEGKERVVFYLSRRLLDAETRYSPVEKLCLCLYFSCTKLRHYLLSNECTVICKADVVKYMLSAPILKARVGKWIFALTEFDLRYESPKAIKGQAIADCIVDHRDDSIGSVEVVPWTLFFDRSVCTHGYGIGLVIISPRGANFEFAYTIKPYASNNQAEYEAVLKGLQLLKEVEANAIKIMGDSLLVISKLAGEYECKNDTLMVYNEKCQELMKEFRLVTLKHGASGYEPMMKDVRVEVAAITADDWRVFLAENVEDCFKYYKGCQDCQKFGATQIAPASAMNPIIKSWPFRGWGIDMIGIINPPSSKGHKFILVEIDYFTKWVEPIPLKKVDSGDAIQFVQEHIICRFGIPQTITTDQGSIFVSDEFVQFADSMGIKLLNSSPYYAQANGLAEASNKSLIKLIKRKISDYPRQWHTRLAEALWSYRMACHVYGHEAVLPWEVRISSRRMELQVELTADEYYNLMADEREDLVQSRLRALAKVKWCPSLFWKVNLCGN
uniref:Retroelement n=2 Tax=Oryza sativa subsp. japonica TaxID=39947 RepID=Q338V3_ORYSJ|nr:Putative retroelement [Oryza sativa Japonica Group]ABB47429.1 retrotransposon protein, putative, unclassified [Oryza sativa Japonica Group]